MSKVCLNGGRANYDKAVRCKRCNQPLSYALVLEEAPGRHPLSLLVILSVLIIAVSLFTLIYMLW
jgi:hypothetical protein